jgi:hypothetical protein
VIRIEVDTTSAYGFSFKSRGPWMAIPEGTFLRVHPLDRPYIWWRTQFHRGVLRNIISRPVHHFSPSTSSASSSSAHRMIAAARPSCPRG